MAAILARIEALTEEAQANHARITRLEEFPAALCSLLNQAVNRIGLVLSVPLRRTKLGPATSWDGDAVCKAWKRYLEKPNLKSLPTAETEYLADEDAVRMALTGYVEYCWTTMLPLRDQQHIQKSFHFVLPDALPLEFCE